MNTTQIIGIILMLPVTFGFIWWMGEDKQFRVDVIIFLSMVGFTVGVLMLIFG